MAEKNKRQLKTKYVTRTYYSDSFPPGLSIITMQKVLYHQSSAPLSTEVFDNWYEITFQLRGKQRYEIDGKIYDIIAGDGLVCYPNEPHSSAMSTFDKSAFYYMIFNWDELAMQLGASAEQSELIKKNFTESFINNRIFKFSESTRKTLDKIFDLLDTESSSFRYTLLRNALSELFIELINLASASGTRSAIDMQSVIHYIETHRSEHYGIDTLASEVHLSVSHFASLFTKEFGMSPKTYILTDRINTAKLLLSETEFSMTEIAMRLGFASPQHFSGIFKKYTFYTPSQWRKKYTGN